MGSERAEEELGIAAELTVKADVPLFVEDAEVEIAAMEADAAGVPVLFLIEAHGSLLSSVRLTPGSGRAR